MFHRSVRDHRIGRCVGARSVIYPNVVIGAHARIARTRPALTRRSARAWCPATRDRAERRGHRQRRLRFVKQPDGSYFKIPQHADVVIEDDVEIGANTRSTARDRRNADSSRHESGQPGRSRTASRLAATCCSPRRSASRAAPRSKTTGAGRPGGRVGALAHRPGRRGHGPDRHSQFGGRGRVHLRASGRPQPCWLKSSAVVRPPALKKRIAQLEASVLPSSRRNSPERRIRQDR